MGLTPREYDEVCTPREKQMFDTWIAYRGMMLQSEYQQAREANSEMPSKSELSQGAGSGGSQRPTPSR